MFDDVSSTTKTFNNIKRTLEKNLLKKYNIQDDTITEKMLSIHGLAKSNFDFISNIETIINEKLNDVSIDDNSNKDEKTIEGIISEVIAPVKKAIGYNYLYRTMKSLYGREEAKRLSGDMLDLSLGLSDSTNVLKNYCYSLDASKIVTIGRDFGMLHSKPAKRISSYISALCETIHQMASTLAGACAIGTLFLDIAHILIYKENIELEKIKNCKTTRKYIENEFQQFVHSVCHLSRAGSESPFTNISIFDRPKLKNLISEKNFGWYFLKDNVTEDYIIDYIISLQEIFLDFFDKGDPLKDGLPYRFPVVTINISKKKQGEEYIVEDIDFLKKICKREIYRYNIFSSEGSKVASCCRLINDIEMIELAAQSNSFGGASVSLGSHRVLTINFMRIVLEAESEEEFYIIFKERLESTAKILKAHKQLLNELEKKGLQQFIRNGWINKTRLFSTFGILGIYEAAILYKEKFNSDKDVTKDMLIYMNEKVGEYSKKYNIIGNIEQIPAESFARRLPQSDKLIFGEELVPYKLYANQFVPLWEEATIWEKFDIDGKYNKLITGGGIVHGTIDSKVTPKQAENLIKYAIKSGCEHFALNAVYSECSEGHVSLGNYEKCPICDNIVVEKLTRVVGFFVKVSSWNTVRRNWEFPKRHMHRNGELNIESSNI